MRSRTARLPWRLAALLSLVPAGALAQEPPRPNVVVVFIDDMGYADIGPFGAEGYETPHLDRLAREGRRLTNFYVSQAVCSASRASLLTGCYSNRVSILGALGPGAEHGLHEDEVTLAEVAKQRGYRTACIGKWHLGHHRRFLPRQHGFDEYFGLPYSNDMWPHHPETPKAYPPLPLYEGDEIADPEVTPEEQAELTVRYTERAVAFVERAPKEPFLLYLAHSMVHVPLFVSERFAGKSGRGLYADVVQEVDWSVGEILRVLEENDLARDTLVLFTSDNGPWLSYGDHAGRTGVLREGKGTMFEGGCRVPTIAWWPSVIPGGTTCDTPAMTIDVLPTVARLIGAELPAHPIDGKDVWNLLSGAPDARSPHEAYYFYYGRQLQAVRSGRFKLHLPHGYRTLGGREGGTGGIPVKYESAQIGQALFDLVADPGETRDVSGEHGDVVERLVALAEAMRHELGDAGRENEGVAVRPAGRL